MTDTLRDKLIQKGWVTPFNADTLMRLIEEHYADEPAVPEEGRELAAITGQPSDAEWDALVKRVWDKYQTVGYQGERFMYDGDFGSALDLVRKELARWLRPVPAPPADGEVAELVVWLYSTRAARLTRAAELLQRQALVPVSVSERPWEREGWCDAEGRFWAEHISRSGVASWRCAAASDLGGWAVRCLPAHALPLPEVNNG